MSRKIERLFSFLQSSNIKKDSVYNIWESLGNRGQDEFLEFITSGKIGESGISAYQSWLKEDGNEGKSFDQFIDTFKKGTIGDKGPIGDSGPDGEAGDKGEKGDYGSYPDEPLDHLFITDSETGKDTEVVLMDGVLTTLDFMLQDFTYIKDEDTGMYYITGWKRTKNGVPSTECIIPNSSRIMI